MNKTMLLPVLMRPAPTPATPATRVVATVPPLYEPALVRQLFNYMALTYRWHAILVAGLTGWWRRQLVARLPLAPGQRVVDLMTGTGELWSRLLPRLGPTGRVRAVDFSSSMLHAAARRRTALPAGQQVSLHHADACCSGLASGSADVVVSAFGLKTLAPAAYPALAAEIVRLLVPGGTVALLELTVPASGWRRLVCLHYMQALNCLLQQIGGPLTIHAHLLSYARRFATLDEVAAACRAAGLINVRVEQLTGGIASVLLAEQPAR
ncbi:class I SAM-dependent methyltransferase [Hymenobacter tibetensis]|uniref:Class I SAM-dependent methyltransferase n=1 Tax=Hymenobacter tibetensis TaxID=497967 RepID=A0ABY4CRS1_9BACT|nr:class I SAM-dependent methyltransferase [Hymenobacter tibetensis]UOG72966.1 class I SAM-dependent methyltransferase [Hymenobacter tibetensis]